MNKKIVMSVSVIVASAAVIIGGTSAFFSDTETSTGNTFTAGAIDLKVDSTQHYNNMICTLGLPDGNGGFKPSLWQPANGETVLSDYPVVNTPCGGSWTETDLGITNKFFDFADVKPGDEGENTISLHVINNDAYVCATVAGLASNDNSLTEPETSVDTNGMASGELDDTMVWNVWRDDGAGSGVAGDNIQNGSEQTLTSGHPVNGTLALYDSTTGAPLTGGNTGYLGVAWSLPLFTGNEVQTDSLTGDISFNVVQSRNNGSFKCSDVTGPTVAASYATGFEPTPYSIGNINGQDGWKKTGSYDSAVSSSGGTTGFGTQSLRISNGFADGAFGGQTFAPLLASGAGETSVAPNKHFEAQFDIASVLPALQSGLAISVSPDNGSGSRMSYLRFEDQADGIHVFFDDVTDAGPLPTVATFNESPIATITRTPHTIKFVMDFVDGASNDVVKIYIDGVLKITGTSWENYYRFDPEQTGSGNVLSPVNTLIFAARGSSVPANLNNGYLFDNLSLSSSL